MSSKSTNEMFPLSASPDGFDINNAFACALASQVAYQAAELIPQVVIDEWGFPDYRRISGSNIQGFIAANNQCTIVAFRGSEAHAENWQDNLDSGFVPGPFNGGDRLHRGFAEGFLQLLPEIESRLKSFERPGSALFVTGHSLGAALATLAAASFYREGRTLHSVYGFGSPRVGCRHFRNSYELHDQKRTFRLVNQHDIIARIPPRFLRYRHVGVLRYLDGKGNIHDDPNFWKRMLIYTDPRGRNPRDYINAIIDRFPESVNDHKIGNYVKKLQALANPH